MVASTDLNNENNVVLNKLVSDFHHANESSTITGTTYTLKNKELPRFQELYGSGTTAVFTPTLPLAANTVYTATVSAAVTNLDNTPCQVTMYSSLQLPEASSNSNFYRSYQ
jgi:hypothetical protein